MFKYITRFYVTRQYLQHCKSSNVSFKTDLKKNNSNHPKVESISIDKDTVELLEQLSLVDCTGPNAVNVLNDAINFVKNVPLIDTEGVEPMYTVLENRYLTLREDEVTEGNCQKEILKNASIIEEDYFVAPPGNIPLPSKK